MKNIAIIPARGGSKTIKNKNLKKIKNKTLIEITIDIAKKTNLFDKIILSSDSNNILNECVDDVILDKRPEYLSTDTSNVKELINYIITKYIDNNDINIIILQPTSPLRNEIDIINSLNFLNMKNVDSVISVCKMDHINIPEKCMYIDNGKLFFYNNNNKNLKRKQDTKEYYFRNGSIYAFKKSSFIKYNNFFGNNCVPYVMEKENSVDIDDYFDYDICKYLYEKRINYKYNLTIYIGSRANYSSLKILIKQLSKSENVNLNIICGGPGLSRKYGNMEKLIQGDGILNYKLCPFIFEGTSLDIMAKSTGFGIIETTNILKETKTDLLLVVGDRYDVLSLVVAASMMNIKIAHTMGGELSGTIDEMIRHVITKFSHIHFPANDNAKNRIIKLGEDEKYVLNYGCPRMDIIKNILSNKLQDDFFSNFFIRNKSKVNQNFNLIKQNYLICIFHPVTTDYENNGNYCLNLLNALNKLQKDVILIWPNSDAGSDLISKEIRKFMDNTVESTINISCIINLPLEEFIPLLNNCLCLVGNSSTGIRDCGFMGVPVVNIGERQQNRLCSENVIHSSNEENDIYEKLKIQINKGKYKKDLLYGDGNACNKIFNYLENLDINAINFEKKITY
jgi:UDP-hydrolysing UDP-N-acetyl-D-glucosamine 2-epimerase